MGILQTLKNGSMALLDGFTVFSGANSFESNRVIGSKRLNRIGLHRSRVRLAAWMTRWRRSRLAETTRPEWREQFERDGFVIVENAVPEADFAALRDAIMQGRWEVRDMVQGDTITRRAAIDDEMMRKVPGLRALLRSRWFGALMRYVSSFDVEPLYYVQSIIKRGGGGPDPQLHYHADTFHSSMKAWLFLEDVAPGEGAFSYVRGSHRLTPERLAWEHEVAQSLPDGGDRLTRRGSFRVSRQVLERLGLPEPEELVVKANTLVVADTFGFHARGPSGSDLSRVELWAYSRRNPFLPWLGGDPLSLPFIAPRRVGWLWRLRDRFPKWLKQPWKPVGKLRMTELPGDKAPSE